MAVAGLEINSQVEIEAEEGRLIIHSTPATEYCLDDLLADCTTRNTSVTDEDRDWLDSDTQGEELW